MGFSHSQAPTESAARNLARKVIKTPQPHPQDYTWASFCGGRKLPGQLKVLCCFWSGTSTARSRWGRKLSSQDLPIAEACLFILLSNRQEVGGKLTHYTAKQRPDLDHRIGREGDRVVVVQFDGKTGNFTPWRSLDGRGANWL